MPTKAEVEKELADLKASQAGNDDDEKSASHKSQADQDEGKRKKSAGETAKDEIAAKSEEHGDDEFTVGDDGGDAGGDAGGDTYGCADCGAEMAKDTANCPGCGSRMSWG